MFTLYQIAGSCDVTITIPDLRKFCRFTPRENKIAFSLLFTHNNADFSAGVHSVTDRSCATPISKVERHTSQGFCLRPEAGRSSRPVVCHSMLSTLMPIFEFYLDFFFNYHILLLKQLMNLLEVTAISPPRSPTNRPI